MSEKRKATFLIEEGKKKSEGKKAPLLVVLGRGCPSSSEGKGTPFWDEKEGKTASREGVVYFQRIQRRTPRRREKRDPGPLLCTPA